LQQIANLRQGITESQHDIRNLEQDLSQNAMANASSSKLNLHGMPVRRASSIRVELENMWGEHTTPQERIDTLAALLDEAEVTPELMTKYHEISSKLSSRLPIIQAISRKQFLEYKVKLAQRAGNTNAADGSPNKGAIPAEIMNELSDLQQFIQHSIEQYEQQYQETFYRLDNEIPPGPGNRIDGPAKNMMPQVLPSPMSGFPNSFFSPNKGTGMSPPTTASKNGGASVTSSLNRSANSSIHRKYVANPADGIAARK
jgi:hypothetical protein